MESSVDHNLLSNFINTKWDKEIIPKLCEFISIPNQSPLFDSEWATNGFMDKAIDLLVDWVKTQEVQGLQIEVVRLEGRTPIIFAEIQAFKTSNKEDTILLYGHLDKQPPLTNDWEEGLGPYKPVIQDGKLYGRGGADDGYSTFAAITALKALQVADIPHARSVLIIEACEESGSFDLSTYIIHLKERIKTPSLIVCLDSGCGTYDQFWMTSTLRGMIAIELRVDVLKEGVHSGHASGVVPSSFRIVRQLLSRIEDVETGKIIPTALYTEIPPARIKQVHATAAILGQDIISDLPLICKTTTDDLAEVLLNRTWRPTLSVTGADGFPSLSNAGNVLRPYSAFKLSIRVPPHVNPQQAANTVKEIIEKDPPYGAKVTCTIEKGGPGWESPALPEWLEENIKKASLNLFGKEHGYIGEGGSIPFMGMLGELYPAATFVVTGLLGPKSNAHGPNEFLHIDMGKKVNTVVSLIIAEHINHLV